MKNDEWFDDKKIHKKLNSDFGVPLSTIYRWTWKWQSDMNWDPADTSVHGDFNRIFTDEQENSVVSFIKENYIDEGNYFSGIHFQSLMFDAYDDAFKHEEETPEFSCSTKFINDFKDRHRISSRLAHFRQRPNDRTIDEINDDLQSFRSQVRSLIDSTSNSDEPVINCDETGYQIMPTNIKTWAFKNSKKYCGES